MRFVKQVVVGLLLTVSLVGAHAAEGDTKTSKKADVNAGTVDVKASKFSWKASKKMGNSHHGDIFLKSAKAKIADGKILSGEFVMDMASFTVVDLKGSDWEDKFLQHVKSGDFFEVEKNPTAKLTIKNPAGKSKLTGDLTIKGKTHPVTIKFTHKGKTYQGKMTFDRTKYGITYNSENFFKVAADKIIKNEVEVNFKVVVK